jgi:predicted secreted protein
MRRNVVPAASARLAASLLLFSAAPALAGDAAAFDPIGFSEDGRYFAYEEYGIQDGSGFPYDTVYVVDLIADKWVGTPVRVRVDDETARLSAVRQQAMTEAKPMLDRAALVTAPEMILLNADGEVGANGLAVRFGSPGNGLDAPREPLDLALSSFDSTSTEPCASYGMEGPVQGFALTLTDAAGNAAEIHRDAAVPASRGCVSDYRIHAVVGPFYSGFNASPLVAVVSVYSLGFEGPNRRFVTVPIVP